MPQGSGAGREDLAGKLQPLPDRGAAACLASARVCGLASAMVPLFGYTGLAKLVPAMTANHTPSRTTSTAAAVAVRAWVILLCGTSIHPEQSMMMISALPDPATAATPGVPSDVTVATALTSRAPSWRYWLWSTSTVNAGWLMRGVSSVDPRKSWRLERERHQDGGDVVPAASVIGDLHQRGSGIQWAGEGGWHGEHGQVGRL